MIKMNAANGRRVEEDFGLSHFQGISSQQPYETGNCFGFYEPESSHGFGRGDHDTDNLFTSYQTSAYQNSIRPPLEEYRVLKTDPNSLRPNSFETQQTEKESDIDQRQDCLILENCYQTVGCDSSSVQLKKINLTDQTGNSIPSLKAVSSKSRIRWTRELHERFTDCISQLGGPEMATPKAILKLMNVDGLSIYHVKSHLQKYRIARHTPEAEQGKACKKTNVDPGTKFNPEVSIQLTDALRLQLDVQRRLKEQLEIQNDLQLRIEEEGKRLKLMLDEQLKQQKNMAKPNKSDLMPQNNTLEDH